MTWPEIRYLFKTIAASVTTLNISYEGPLLTVLIGKDVKAASSKKHTQIKTRVLKLCPI